MEDVKEIINIILSYGLTGVLLIALLLLIHDPDRAEKLKALFFKPLFFLFKWGSKEYLAAEVGYTATEFFKKHVKPFIPSMADTKIKIKWVTSASDPILSSDGTLILRLEETNDQTRNILAATRVSLPHVVCADLRSHLEQYAQVAIDLALLRNLADKLGKHARPIFQRYFLNPEIEKNKSVADLVVKLIKLDDNGIFLTIFLEELNLLGTTLYDDIIAADKTNEMLSFVEYLIKLANREIGEEMCLEYLSSEIRTGIVLLAKTRKAEELGVTPYIQAINIKLKQGCDSIYVIAYPEAHDFSKRLTTAIDGDVRLTLIKTNKIKVKSPVYIKNGKVFEISLLRRNKLSSDNSFSEKLMALSIRESSLVKGVVLDISQCATLIDVQGLNAVVYRDECSWRSISKCSDVLHVGSTYQFKVKSIDKNQNRLNLSLRLPEEDPWKSQKLPKVNDVIEVDIVGIAGPNYIGHYCDNIEILIPKYEVSWLGSDDFDPNGLLQSRQKIIIYERSGERRLIKGSIRRMEQNPWPKIHKRFPKGKELRAIVQDVTPDFVRVSLPDGLTGHIPKEEMMLGGFEYADYEQNVVSGQGLNVVVSKVFIDRQRIRLALKRVVDHQKKQPKI
jgi:predicted RNA-binding protein with RPS1 domain